MVAFQNKPTEDEVAEKIHEIVVGMSNGIPDKTRLADVMEAHCFMLYTELKHVRELAKTKEAQGILDSLLDSFKSVASGVVNMNRLSLEVDGDNEE